MRGRPGAGAGRRARCGPSPAAPRSLWAVVEAAGRWDRLCRCWGSARRRRQINELPSAAAARAGGAARLIPGAEGGERRRRAWTSGSEAAAGEGGRHRSRPCAQVGTKVAAHPEGKLGLGGAMIFPNSSSNPAGGSRASYRKQVREQRSPPPTSPRGRGGVGTSRGGACNFHSLSAPLRASRWLAQRVPLLPGCVVTLLSPRRKGDLVPVRRLRPGGPSGGGGCCVAPREPWMC